MLRKSLRLAREHFKDLQISRRSFHSEHFILKTAEATTGPRFGVSVSKKVAKKAVVRNRTRRRAYAALSPLVPSLPAKLYLLVAKHGAEKLQGEMLQSELALLLKKG